MKGLAVKHSNEAGTKRVVDIKIPKQEVDNYALSESHMCVCLCWITSKAEEGKRKERLSDVSVLAWLRGGGTLAGAQSAVRDNKGHLTDWGLHLGQTWKRTADTLPAQCSGEWVWVQRNMCPFFILFQDLCRSFYFFLDKSV